MARPDTDNDFSIRNYRLPIKNRLTIPQVVELDKELRNFKVTTKNGTYVDEDAYAKYKGALSSNGAVIISNHIASLYSDNGRLLKTQDCDPIAYEQLREDLEQWKWWKGIEAKKLLQLEEMV